MKHLMLSLALFAGMTLFACPSEPSAACKDKNCAHEGHASESSHIHEHAEEQEKFRLKPEKKEAPQKEASSKKKLNKG